MENDKEQLHGEDLRSRHGQDTDDKTGEIDKYYSVVFFRRSDQIFIISEDAAFKQVFVDGFDAHVGVQSVEDHSSQTTLVKVCGTPFSASHVTGSGDSCEVKEAVTEALKQLYEMGWVLEVSTSLTRRHMSLTWMFHKKYLEDKPSEAKILCLGVASCDLIEFFNIPPDVFESVQQTIQDHYPKGIQNISHDGETVKTVKLNGTPFERGLSAGATQTYGKMVFAAVMARLEQHGYQFYATGNFQGTATSVYFRPVKECHMSSFSSYVVLCPEDFDDLRIYNAPDGLIDQIGEAISQSWHKGIQDQGELGPGFEWKLCGNPWSESGGNCIAARKMILRIFDVMAKAGYEHYCTVSLSRNAIDKSTMIYRKTQTPVAELATHYAAINPVSSDKLRLIGLEGDPLREIVPEIVAKIWSDGLQDHTEASDYIEMKLFGTPWESVFSSTSDCQARVLMANILAGISTHGWSVLSAADLSARGGDKNNTSTITVDCWIIVKRYDQITPKALGAPPTYAEAMRQK